MLLEHRLLGKPVMTYRTLVRSVLCVGLQMTHHLLPLSEGSVASLTAVPRARVLGFPRANMLLDHVIRQVLGRRKLQFAHMLGVLLQHPLARVHRGCWGWGWGSRCWWRTGYCRGHSTVGSTVGGTVDAGTGRGARTGRRIGHLAILWRVKVVVKSARRRVTQGGPFGRRSRRQRKHS